jgi:DNA-binding NarL/FixJ family response regulator
MIVCAIDDLIFSIKIKTAAKQLGVEIHFETFARERAATIRDKRPGLVIFDLNSSRLAPMEAIAAMKADPELKRVMTLGYVSHVDSEAIAEARAGGHRSRAGALDVAERLGAILGSSGALLS